MSFSPILSRDIVNTRLLLNAIKREKYLDTLRDAVVGDYKWSARIGDFSGWLLCDGRSIDRTTYSALYDVITTTHGSTSASDFKLPDCRGRALFAAGQPTGNITYNADTLSIGAKFGNQKHLLTIPEMPSHNHTGTTYESNIDKYESETVAKTGIGEALVSGSEPRYLTLNIANTGGGTAHDIQNPTIVVGNVVIYSGVFEPDIPLVDIIGPNDNTYNA